MTAKFTVQIPYGERSKYYPVIEKINSLVDEKGVCGLFVNNIPYSLDALLVIETDANAKEIEEIIITHKLCVIPEKGLDEIVKEISGRKWNYIILPNEIHEVGAILDNLFYFDEVKTFEGKGYTLNDNAKKKKLFISYSHKDKPTVDDIVRGFKVAGLNFWMDTQEIDLGDNILEKMSEGIKESQLAVIFLSRNTLTAKMASFELFTFLKNAINNNKSIVTVLLDDVNPDDIIEGLGLYKYFSFYTNPDVAVLVEMLEQKLSKV